MVGSVVFFFWCFVGSLFCWFCWLLLMALQYSFTPLPFSLCLLTMLHVVTSFSTCWHFSLLTRNKLLNLSVSLLLQDYFCFPRQMNILDSTALPAMAIFPQHYIICTLWSGAYHFSYFVCLPVRWHFSPKGWSFSPRLALCSSSLRPFLRFYDFSGR